MNIPWPPSILSPNNRSHWAKKHKHKSKYKSDCYYLAKQNTPTLDNNISLAITFHPPDNRKRDMDNMLASIKAGLDGIAQAWGVDDSRFRLTLQIGEVVKNGTIRIETEPV